MLRRMAITRHSRRLRRWISGGVLVALLFMQFATVAYACPALAKSVQTAAAMAAMPDCHGMDGVMDHDLPNLCKAHCDKDGQSTAATAAPDLQPNPAALVLLMGVVAPTLVLTPALLESGPSPWLVGHSGAPPLYLSLLVLRN
jgi:hypothetical protein